MTLRTNDNGIDREMTADEKAAYLAMQKELEAQAEAGKAKQIARTALLARLGITSDEAKLLLG